MTSLLTLKIMIISIFCPNGMRLLIGVMSLCDFLFCWALWLCFLRKCNHCLCVVKCHPPPPTPLTHCWEWDLTDFTLMPDNNLICQLGLSWCGWGVNGLCCSSTTILDRIKWNRNAPSPPNQGWRCVKAKTRHFPITDFGGRGGLNVPFNLSKIVDILSSAQVLFLPLALDQNYRMYHSVHFLF